MKLLTILLCWVVHLIALSKSDNKQTQNVVHVLLPKIYHVNNALNVAVQSSSLTFDAHVVVEFFDSKILQVLNYEGLKTQVLHAKDGKKDQTLKLTFFRNVNSTLSCSRQEVNIKKFLKRIYTFVQFDKPIYKPGDKIQYRIICLDNLLKPKFINSIDVSFINPKGVTILKNDITDFEVESNHIDGIFENSFQLNKETTTGNWTMQVNLNNKTMWSKNILVAKYESPLYDIKVITKPHVIFFEDKITAKIDIRYSFGENVKGNVMVSLCDVLNPLSNSQQWKLICKKNIQRHIESMEIFEFRLRNELKIVRLRTDPQLFVIRVIFDDPLGKTVTKLEKVFIHREASCNIEVFSPVLNPVRFGVMIKDHHGNLFNTTSFVTASTKVGNKIFSKDSPLQNGIAFFDFGGTSTQGTNFEVKLGTRCSRAFDLLQSLDGTLFENFRVQYDPKKPNLNDTITITIQYSSPLKKAFYIVQNRLGFIKSHSEKCNGNKMKCMLKLDITDRMLPHSTVNVFGTVDESGDLMQGSFDLEFERQGKNFINMTILNNKIQPGRNLTMSITSNPQSSVYFLAIDKRLTYIASADHDFSHKQFSTAYAIDDKSIHVIKEDFSVMSNCTAVEEAMFYHLKTRKQTSLQSSFSNFEWQDSINDMYIDEEEGSDEYFDITDEEIRTDFSDTWLFEKVNLKKNTRIEFSYKTPDSITSWIISAFSVNKNLGIAIADKKELTTFKNFFVILSIPYSVKVGEIIDIDAKVFNFLANETIEAELVFSVDKSIDIVKTKNINTCEITPLKNKEERKTLTVFSGRGAKVTFRIRTSLVGIFDLKIKASGKVRNKKRFYNDGEKRQLIVEETGIREFSLLQEIISTNISQRVDPLNTRIFDANSTSCIKRTFELYTDIISKSLRSHDSYYQLPDSCGEQTAAKFSILANTYYHLFHVRKDSLKAAKVKITLNNVFQRFLNFFHNDGYYLLWSSWYFWEKKGSNVWLTAYAISIYGQAMNLGIVEENLEIVKKALRYLDSHKISINKNYETLYKWDQQADYNKFPCNFKKDGELNRKYEIKYWLTTAVMLAFLQNKHRIGNEFNDTITGGMNYIKTYMNKFDACSAATASYAFVLDASGESLNLAYNTVKSLEKREMNGKRKYIFDEKNVNDEANVLISSFAALTLLKLNKGINETYPIISWLSEVRDSNGYFAELFDTTIALSALLSYAEKLPKTNSKFYMKIINNNNDKTLDDIILDTETNQSFIKEYEEQENDIKIQGFGEGYLHINDVCEYYLKSKTFRKNSNLKVVTNLNENVGTIKVCVDLTMEENEDTAESEEDNSGEDSDIENEMTIIEIQLQSGFVFNPEFLKEFPELFANQTVLKNVEGRNGNTVVILYLQRNSLDEPTHQCVQIKVFRATIVSNLKTAYVKAYIYNRYNKFNMEPYSFGSTC